MPTTITGLTVHDIRFPTSRMLDGSDAMNPDPDYSAAYVILKTDHADGLAGQGQVAARKGKSSGHGKAVAPAKQATSI